MRRRLPDWFKQKIPERGAMQHMDDLLRNMKLHTICENAICPNIGQCFAKRTATFLVLGDTCTRNCSFCAVKKGKPQPPDPLEIDHITQAANALKLAYVVITSVTRDDLEDGGASHFAAIVAALFAHHKDILVEVLIPDFEGSKESIACMVSARPNVINHNIETVPRLYPYVRPQADYLRSLDVLAFVKATDRSIITKSGVMLGLGESREEVLEVMADLRKAGCDLLTLGQYLQPSSEHHEIVRFVTPDEFNYYAEIGKKMGFAGVASAPLVRSSYRAGELYSRACEASRHDAGAIEMRVL